MKFITDNLISFVRLMMQSISLALSQIWANKTRSILTTIGIIIGVASVTAVIAALSGLQKKILSEFESFGTNKLYIQPHRPSTGVYANLPFWRLIFKPEQFDGLLEHCPSVQEFTRVSWAGRNTVRFGEKSVSRIRTYGVDPSWHKIENRPPLLGRPFSMVDNMQAGFVCMIDPDMRDELQLDKDCINELLVIGSKTYKIIGVLEQRPEMEMLGEAVGGRGRENWEIFIPFRTNLKINDNPWTWAIATSKSTNVSQEAQAEISFFLRKTRGIKPGQQDTFRVMSVDSEIQKFKKVATMITLVAGGVVGISLLVGGVGIMNIMLVSVSERTREIGLRKAVGAKSSAILTQFLIEAIVLCLVGGITGVGFGQLLTGAIANIPNANLDQAYIPFWAIAMACGFSAFVGVFFGMFPAVKAAKLDPIEALRHE